MTTIVSAIAFDGAPVDALYPNDPLWDGQQCPSEEAPCCTHPNMPWFNKTLNETTTEDIGPEKSCKQAMEAILLMVCVQGRFYKGAFSA